MWFALVLLSVSSWARADERAWIRHSGFEVFRQGRAGDGGENLYVSRRGRVQTIRRLDLNLDGEIDLVFTQDHNDVYTPDALIYWGTEEGFHSLLPEMWELRAPFSLLKWIDNARGKITRLPGMGGGRGLARDLNADGYPDLVFGNFMHNYRPDQAVSVYWGDPTGFNAHNRMDLPAFLASGVAAEDFNGDTIPDLVVANAGDERGDSWGYRLHLESYIYWGSADGYAANRRTVLPTISAADVVAGDFNGDGSFDIFFVNTNAKELSAYVYWNDGAGNFGADRRQALSRADLRMASEEIIGHSARRGMRAACRADLNGDACHDLIVAGQSKAVIYQGSRGGLDVAGASELPAHFAMGVAAHDLNADGRVEVIVANAGEYKKSPSISTIYWGTDSGYDAEERTDLPTLGAATIDVGDLNADSYPDLLFGNAHDVTNSDVPSYIYWGGPRGYAPYKRSELTGFSVVGSAIEDLNRDGRLDVLLVSHLSGRVGTLPTVIFWGNPHHYYGASSSTLLDITAAMEYSVGDLDDDGFPDLVFNNGDGGEHGLVWWGSGDGYVREGLARLPVTGCKSNAIGDLNSDGRLDLLFTANSLKPGSKMADAVIIWGNDERFVDAETTRWEIEGGGIESTAIADFNRDGYLDLVFPVGLTLETEIYWGGPAGYSKRRTARVPAHGPPHAVPADLDADGWLDLVLTSGAHPERFSVNTDTYVYWGRADGYSASERTVLEGYTGLDATVGDLNRDGHLDIVSTNYRSDTNRKSPTFVYWGDGTRDYNVRRRQLLRAGSGAAVDNLDLNRDGWPELIVSNHQFFFDHAAGTDIFWGGPEGYSMSERSVLPTVGIHLDAMVDAGHVYDRRYEWDYVGPVVEAPRGRRFVQLAWTAESKLRAAVQFQVRTAGDRRRLAEAVWRGPQGPASYYTESGAALVGVAADQRVLEYRALFVSPDGANTAYLTEVAVATR